MSLPVLASAQSIVAVNPDNAVRGNGVDVAITGSGTIFQQDSEVTSVVWLAQGASRIDGTNINVTSATALTAHFSIPLDTPLGLWDVNVEQVGGSVVTLTDGFTINSACSISDLAAGTQTACIPATNTYTQVVVVTFTNPPGSGNLVVNGQSFAISTSPQSVTLTGLTADGAAVNVTASFSAESTCSRTENALFTAPVSCAVQPCSISDLAAGTQTACIPATNTYTQVVVVTFANPPASGNLVVNGQNFAIGTSPQSVTLTGLVANGAAVNVTANFSADTNCSRTENALFTAPVSCAVQPCSISDLAAGTQTACDPATNTYTQVVVVTFANPPATGNLVVNGQNFAIGTSPQSVTLTGLVANGAAVNVTANFSADTNCSRTENALFTAPASCAPVCGISDLAAGTQTACDPATNTYTQVVVVTFANPPATGNLVVNGQNFAIGTSPQSVTLTGLVANGAAVNVTASFSANSSCSRTENALFTAPASCAPVCGISDLAAGTQTACDPATNTYTQEVVVTFANPPASGNLVVNGQNFAIGTSPQTVTLTGLVANGAAVNVTASFSANSSCSRTENALFTAPASCTPVCGISDLAAGAQTPCDPATNTYTQVVVVTFANPPATGNLVVNGQNFAIGTSPQSVTLTGLVSDGAAVNVTARFSANTSCSLTENALFTAPQRCRQGGELDCSEAEASQDVLWPPKHKFTRVSIEGVEASNGGDADITITGVTSDEPVHDDTCPDAKIHSDGTVDLRAERSDEGNGRVYTIHFTATDDTGASCDGTVFVCVPHDQSHAKKVDDDNNEHSQGRRHGHGDKNKNGNGHGHDGDHDGDHDGANDSDGHDDDIEGGCIRDEVQYDATNCNAAKTTLPGSTPAVIARLADHQVTIQFTNAMTGPVDLGIFDLRGRQVRRLATQTFQAGQHEWRWDGRDGDGREAPSGVYLVRVVMSGEPYTAKTVWLR